MLYISTTCGALLSLLPLFSKLAGIFLEKEGGGGALAAPFKGGGGGGRGEGTLDAPTEGGGGGGRGEENLDSPIEGGGGGGRGEGPLAATVALAATATSLDGLGGGSGILAGRLLAPVVTASGDSALSMGENLGAPVVEISCFPTVACINPTTKDISCHTINNAVQACSFLLVPIHRKNWASMFTSSLCFTAV